MGEGVDKGGGCAGASLPERMRWGIDESYPAKSLAPPETRCAGEGVGQDPPAVLDSRVDPVEGEGPSVEGRIINRGDEGANDEGIGQTHGATQLDDREVGEALVHIGPYEIEEWAL